MSKRILAVRGKGVLSIGRVCLLTEGHQLTRGRLCAAREAAVGVAWIRHQAGRIAVGSMLGYVAPASTGMAGRMARVGRGSVWVVVVLDLESVLMDGLGPWPPRPACALQFAAAAATTLALVARGRIWDGRCVTRRGSISVRGLCAWSTWRGYSRWGNNVACNSVMRDSVPLRRVVLADDLWTRGRVGGVDFVLYVVPRAFLVVVFVFLVVVVVFLALFVFFVVFLVGRLRGGVFVLAGGDYLDAGRVLVGKVVVVFEGARVVIDCDSLPEWHESGGADGTALEPPSAREWPSPGFRGARARCGAVWAKGGLEVEHRCGREKMLGERGAGQEMGCCPRLPKHKNGTL